MKVVINKCFGGFGLSQQAVDALTDKCSHEHDDYESRTCPALVKVVEELGAAAGGVYSDLAVVEIPDGVEFEIREHDGREHIAETLRTWGLAEKEKP